MEKKVKKNNIEDFPSRKISDYGITPCDVIFNQVDKPLDYIFCKSMNVYDDRWRVNIYSKRLVDGIEGKYISSSYFVKFDTEHNKLTIL
jgi:hypothetical protein